MYSSYSCENILLVEAFIKKTAGEHAKKKMLTFEKIKEKFQTKFFIVVKVFHCLPLEIIIE